MIENLRKSIGYFRQGARGLQLLTRVLIYFTAYGISQVNLLIAFRTNGKGSSEAGPGGGSRAGGTRRASVCPSSWVIAGVPNLHRGLKLRLPPLASQLSVYQVFSEASMLATCGHTFCQPCIVTSMGVKRECPMCRAAQPPRKRYSASLSFAAGSARRGAG